ncbi:MAG: hypothetical protein WAO36_04310, partial [Candidatus Methanoculleus thermohydrogenotrophicum]
QIEEIRKRTADVPEDEKPRMMQPDLSPRARQGGGDTIESYFIGGDRKRKERLRGDRGVRRHIDRADPPRSTRT